MKITKVKKITDHNYLNLFSATYTDRLKSEKQWIFASRSDQSNPLEDDHTTPDAVVIVPFHAHEEKLILIKEFRVALGGYQHGFPAGLVDKGESIEDAGKRELFEETGLKVTRVLKKSPVLFSSSGMTDESISLLYVECEGTPSSEFNEASENIEVIMLSQQSGSDLLLDDSVKFDIKTWIVLNNFVSLGSI